MTAPEAGDPLADKYGDAVLVQSQAQTGRVWTAVGDLNASFKDQEVLLRGRVHTVRGKGKSAFIVLRQRTATTQVRPGAGGSDHLTAAPPPSVQRQSTCVGTMPHKAQWEGQAHV